MRSTTLRILLGVCLLALVSTAAWAIPPYCGDVCEFRQAGYHCSYPPFGTITCGDFCTIYCPGSCSVLLTEDSFLAPAPWMTADGSGTSSDLASKGSAVRDRERLQGSD